MAHESERATVTFAPSGISVAAALGTTLAEAARAAGLLLATPCAGRGVCGGCGVRVLSGSLEPPDEAESRALSHAPDGVRLACRARVSGHVEVRPLFATTRPTESRSGRSQAGAAVEPSSARVAVGVDLGTTSVAALVVDAASGREIARAARPNEQAAFGADVLSRISAAMAGERDALQRAAASSVRAVLADTLPVGCAAAGGVERIMIAGNSAMAALLEGADVSSLATHPFSPPVGGGPVSAATRELMGVSAAGGVDLVAPIAAFVGGDALAATLAAGLVDAERPMLLVDVGTNAELVLATPGGLVVTSTAAGPAFEGRGISCGGPVGPGAVQRIEISAATVSARTVGDASPTWFSGAGLVSAIAALLKSGHLTGDGRMQPEGPLAERFSTDAMGVLQVDLSPDADGRLIVNQLDVRAIQLAKAAVRVGIETLLRAAQVVAGDLEAILVAGAFGAALEPADLVAIGMLPANVAHIRRVGNAALEGAAALALDPSLTGIAERAALGATHVDLASDARFGMAFVSATEFRAYEA